MGTNKAQPIFCCKRYRNTPQGYSLREMATTKKFRVLTAELEHETNTFCVIPTSLQNFRNYQFIDTSAEIELKRRGTKSSLGASFEAADQFRWELVPSLCAVANPTGKVTSEAFEQICEIMFAPLKAQLFDGLLLFLHGAMVTGELFDLKNTFVFLCIIYSVCTDTYEDAEGELLARIRNIVGPEVPIFVTLDLHGNITTRMVDNCSCLIAVRTYPHIDYYERAWQAAKV